MSPIDRDIALIAKKWDLDAAFLQAVVEATVARLDGESRAHEPSADLSVLTGLMREQGQRLEALIAQQQAIVDALATRREV